jgi:hypothetical protein
MLQSWLWLRLLWLRQGLHPSWRRRQPLRTGSLQRQGLALRSTRQEAPQERQLLR